MGETIQLKASDGHELAAYVAEPDGALRGGVVVIQEIFGVNSHVQAVADGFAAQGYKAIAPALFDRIERDVELGYDAEGVKAGRDLKGQMDVVGYCWGGSLSWLSATRLDGIAAAICYYGGQINDFRDETAKCPVLMHFGSEDGSIPIEAVEAIRAAQPNIPIHVYQGAGHGFNCDHRASYDEGASATAGQRTIEFLAANVG
jgi:carboxymethylenebutenolidase